MLLTKGIIKADLIAARQAIEYFQNKKRPYCSCGRFFVCVVF